LLPGSTITPFLGANQIGPTEPLSGSFTWRRESLAGDHAVFDATFLHFQSASFLLTLNMTPINNFGSGVWTEMNATTFAEVVDVVGLSTSPLLMSSLSGPPMAAGIYDGPVTSPTRLVYPDLVLGPVDGGLSQARVSFTAVLVPEPEMPALLLAGIVLFVGRWAWLALKRANESS
jgi:hypothetical protein